MPTPNPYTLAPTVYSRILEIVPGLHATPPVLPSFISKDFPPSPESGYTLTIHVGVAQSHSALNRLVTRRVVINLVVKEEEGEDGSSMSVRGLAGERHNMFPERLQVEMEDCAWDGKAIV
ncbi:hypothetical protein VKT23_001488 [Stygiomarasmius scandens]|uniref:Uncharacterized protein n=1 Tax=Marasmiellus scandens TaxID=2682957 RepID=A0ABR1JZ04_9AGAR